jgi:hypothetical protein
MVHGNEVWGRRRRPGRCGGIGRRIRRPRPLVTTFIPPVSLYNGCIVESGGGECVVYHIRCGCGPTTTIIVLYDPCRNVTFEVPYDAFRGRWRRTGRSWGITQLMRAQCRSPEMVEDGRW